MEYRLDLMKGSPLSKKTIEKILIVGLSILAVVIVLNDLKGLLIWHPAPPHQVESLESFELVWYSSIKSPIVLIDSCTSRDEGVFMHLDTNENQLVLPIWEGNLLFPKLYLTDFELDTGEIQWQTRLDSNDLALNSNSKNIFAVVQETEKCTPDERGYCDAVRISSYNISSGEEDWFTYHGNMNRADTICVNDKILSISGFATRSNFREKVSFAVDTGEKLVYQDISPPSGNYFQDWNLDQLKFRRFDIISNYEQNGRFLFFLTKGNNTLWAIDRDVSEIVGHVRFDGTSFGTGNYIDRFAIISNNDIVAVYLGDGEQLFAFRFSPNE